MCKRGLPRSENVLKAQFACLLGLLMNFGNVLAVGVDKISTVLISIYNRTVNLYYVRNARVRYLKIFCIFLVVVQ